VRLPDLGGHRLAGHVGEPQVQDDDVWVDLLDEQQRLGARGCGDDRQPLALEVDAHQVADLRLVLDDEDSGRHDSSIVHGNHGAVAPSPHRLHIAVRP
jgi:hypothetical protein